jgi:hypothetical protein
MIQIIGHKYTKFGRKNRPSGSIVVACWGIYGYLAGNNSGPMKRTKTLFALFPVFFILLLGFSCSRQPDVKPPVAVASAFAARFSEADQVKWDSAGHGYRAVFNAAGHPVTAFFAPDGNWLKTETEMITSELPSVVVQTIVAAFPGNTVMKTARVDSAGNVTYYRLDIRRKGKTTVLRLSSGGVILTTP